jgi:ubiquinone/menaquinone biosynthesis C-methylase UbiE
MSVKRVGYDGLASTYDERYADGGMSDIGAALADLVREVRPGAFFEVGCGTGHWLAGLRPPAGGVFGLDLSMGMLLQAQAKAPAAALARGDASRLPYRDGVFDLMLSVHALHHFADQPGFIAEARRVLRPSGVLAIVTMDPHSGRDHWYVYDYFEDVAAVDLRRFPRSGQIVDWLVAAGFERITWGNIEHVHQEHANHAVFKESFLAQNTVSQLALLTPEAYEAGLARIRADADAAEAAGQIHIFTVDLWISMITAQLPPA